MGQRRVQQRLGTSKVVELQRKRMRALGSTANSHVRKGGKQGASLDCSLVRARCGYWERAPFNPLRPLPCHATASRSLRAHLLVQRHPRGHHRAAPGHHVILQRAHQGLGRRSVARVQRGLGQGQGDSTAGRYHTCAVRSPASQFQHNVTHATSTSSARNQARTNALMHSIMPTGGVC